ncbi:hypothetical protein HDV03_002949, partial [Kappamyces sp. JEL0829]
MPVDLALACWQLLEKLKVKYPNGVSGYRLTYEMKSNQLKLKIPPIVWFDTLESADKNQIAWNWINSIKQLEQQSHKELYSAKTPIVIQAPEYCTQGVKCDYWKKNLVGKGNPCYKQHSLLTCIAIVKDLAQNEVKCNYYIPEELVVNFDKCDERFLVLVRQDDNLTRDLLVVPKPAPIGFLATPNENNCGSFVNAENETWPGHYSNEEFVQFEETWAFFQSVCERLLKKA